LEKHKEDIDKMIEEFIEACERSEEYFIPAVSYSPSFRLEYLWVKSRLCSAVNDIKKKYEILWEDMDNHFPDIVKDIEEHCNEIKEYNGRLHAFEERINSHVEQVVDSAVKDFKGLADNGYKSLLCKVLISCLSKERIMKTIEDVKGSISREIANMSVEDVNGNIQVGGCIVRLWGHDLKKRTVKELVKIIEENKYELRVVYEMGTKLQEEKKRQEEEVLRRLKEVLMMKALPMKRTCKFI